MEPLIGPLDLSGLREVMGDAEITIDLSDLEGGMFNPFEGFEGYDA